MSLLNIMIVIKNFLHIPPDGRDHHLLAVSVE